ncbi:DUF695 domain-containing protein [Flammeovirga yaeyamensis]|uniref:DUF695 domain-containing protein n=2 Tax=Flammeovirga yaeyamensis TaxID=367791 RepID=A0AAX1NAC5_9BACT|nr:DUF695 domain-containing protein [Flammeovirga yaeyamensis]NMF35547.1 DUF695 domain-containing protein [Flammeovirga yaeyamensis]QWG04405.1 DUF695 domain-containing protein [Flammeovirga yaeyamensis]
MGLMNFIFGKPKKQATTTKTTYVYQADWESYFLIGTNPEKGIYVDLGLKKVAPLLHQENMLKISIEMLSPKANGLASQRENETLFEIEESLSEELWQLYDITYAGRLTENGERHFYFYVDTYFRIEERINEIMSEYGNYNYSTEIQNDPLWRNYFGILFPTDQQYSIILNKRLNDAISKLDSLIKL